MKSTVKPPVRVDPELRAQVEAVLGENETLSEEDAVRHAVDRRRTEAAFFARAEAAWQAYRSTGAAAPAEEVVAKLQGKLDAHRKQLLGG